ncbi:hypothetical protein DL98DRAFT_599122 [Cadophora sp. DSE1049]|nr:hypothetical protein DL98DRAFT_599122 [Cadophora sp. DSE1049]
MQQHGTYVTSWKRSFKTCYAKRSVHSVESDGNDDQLKEEIANIFRTGLASPCKRKRKSSKKTTTSVDEDTTVKTRAAIDKSRADVDTEVSTPSAVDEDGVEVAVEDAAVGTPAVVAKPGTNAAPKDTAGGTPPGHIESVSSKVMTDSLRSSG